MDARSIYTAIRLTIAMLFIVVVSACASGASTVPSSDQAFWDALKITGSEAESYTSLQDMAAQADAVVVGTFESFGESRRIFGDAAEDIVTYAAATVGIKEVIRGTVPDNKLPVEFLINAPVDNVDAAIATIAADLPQGELLLFLRVKGPGEEGFYRLVNSTGLWTTTPGGVDAPLSEKVIADHDHSQEVAAPYAQELCNISSLASLVDYVRDVRQ